MNPQATGKPRVGISRCLLGDRVRYDGDSTPLSDAVLSALNSSLELVAVCPEVEAGLGIPRPPVRLTASIENPRVTGRDNTGLDVTDVLISYCERRIDELGPLAGYIFKSRSPSCGLHSTPVFINDTAVTETSRGVFARSLCTAYPGIPVIEETDLPHRLDEFIAAVSAYTGQ
jgi:uncharacterized protein YbbK (DUF523 family)